VEGWNGEEQSKLLEEKKEGEWFFFMCGVAVRGVRGERRE
jgi:hypothetical protein